MNNRLVKNRASLIAKSSDKPKREVEFSKSHAKIRSPESFEKKRLAIRGLIKNFKKDVKLK